MEWPVTRIEAFRKAKTLTLQALGAELGRSQPQAQRYCAGITRPGREASDRLKALTFGVIHAGNYADPITETEAASMMAEIDRRAAAATGEACHD